MTNEEFFRKYCVKCGTKQCPANEEVFKTCGTYMLAQLGLEITGIDWANTPLKENKYETN